jgi:hypothetical protein
VQTAPHRPRSYRKEAAVGGLTFAAPACEFASSQSRFQLALNRDIAGHAGQVRDHLRSAQSAAGWRLHPPRGRERKSHRTASKPNFKVGSWFLLGAGPRSCAYVPQKCAARLAVPAGACGKRRPRNIYRQGLLFLHHRPALPWASVAERPIALPPAKGELSWISPSNFNI